MNRISFPSMAAPMVRLVGSWIASRSAGDHRICIINYHRILEVSDPLLASEPDITEFQWQMELLSRCFNVLPLYDAVTALRERRLPPRAVCITFDDGYRSSYDLALPLLQRFGLPATVFVTTGYAAEHDMWNDRLVEVVRRFPHAELDLREAGLERYSLATPFDRQKTILKLTEGSKYLPPKDRLDLTEKLEKLVGNTSERRLMLTPEMVLSLSRHGIEVGGHTISHPILTRISDDEARKEIVENKRQLEEITGKSVRLFAYPNGKSGIDYDARHVQMAKDAGYAAAFTTSIGAANSFHDPYQLPRCRPWDTSPLMYSARLLYWLGRNSV